MIMAETQNLETFFEIYHEKSQMGLTRQQLLIAFVALHGLTPVIFADVKTSHWNLAATDF